MGGLLEQLLEYDLRLQTSKLPNKEDENDMRKLLELIKISTFDMEFKNKQNIKNNGSENISTELDLILYDLINDFKLYQLKLKNLVEKESDIIGYNIKNLSDETSDLLMLKKLVQEKEKKVNLSKLKRPQAFDFWWMKAISWLKKLYNCFNEKQKEKVNGYNWKEIVGNKLWAKSVLQVFFESIGYEIIL